ncbi:MAG: hypothetical protein HUJ22_05190 [Gracilimonas sp.]|uniref:hypothetical protein n=1 Tax=Gracilimonas sp. TaxID=1974203 RepID=UPI0019CC9D92|nr:hypothetical protein [Gracilimonas sp.]MBD3615949.1 hypothetical protein [Gracilimonas sp.]
MKYSKLWGIFSQLLIVTLFFSFSLISCTEKEKDVNTVEVTAKHDAENNQHIFDLSTKETKSGWVTFNFNNASPSDHFFMLYKVPEAAIQAAEEAGEPVLQHWYGAITAPFQEQFNPYINGNVGYGEFVDNLVAEISEKGPWFFDPGAPPMGGPGFTAAGSSSVTTVYLDPGEYIVECYVKDEEQVFHSYIGMLEQLTVTSEKAEAEEPRAHKTVTISSENGIVFTGPFEAGEQVVEVHYADQTTYSHLLGHNVQLVKLEDAEDDSLLQSLGEWMNWTTPFGLTKNAPTGAKFVGGVMAMTEGQSGYMHLDLEPGDYAWIAEVPDPADKGMLKTFTISE